MRRLRFLPVVVTASVLWSPLALAQKAADCPPGAWFCADASVSPTPAPTPTPAPGVSPPSSEPKAPLHAAEGQPPPGFVYMQPEPAPAAGPLPLTVVPPTPAQYDAPPPPPPPRRGSRWALQLRVETAAMGDADGRSSNAGMAGVGGSLRARPTPHFAFDFGLDGLGGRDFAGRRRSELAFSVNPMIFLNPQNPFQIYLLAGIGASSASVEHTQAYHYVALDAGAGVEWRVSPQIALDLDFVGFIRERTDGDARDNPEFIDPSTGRTTNSSGGGLLRAGIAFYW
jgi:hypothetical protein